MACALGVCSALPMNTLSHTDDDTITSDDITTLYTEEIQVTYSASATGTS